MLRRHWLYFGLGSIIALLLPPGAAGQKPPLKPLTVVRLAAQATANAIKSADLRGAIETVDPDGETQKHAQFRLRFAKNRYLVELVPKKGFRYDRIVAVADDTGVCEATFSDRIRAERVRWRLARTSEAWRWSLSVSRRGHSNVASGKAVARPYFEQRPV